MDAERELERRLAAAIRDDDPVAAVRAIADDPALPEVHRRALRAAAPRGIAMTAVLVARLRFERLVQGSDEAGAWFESDPERFARVFRDYHRSVPPTAFFPADEAALFRSWLAGRPMRRRGQRRSPVGALRE